MTIERINREIGEKFIGLVFSVMGGRIVGDDLTRPVYVTPIPGNYGLAGYVFTIEGSPPRGMMLVELGDGPINACVLITRNGFYRKLPGFRTTRAGEVFPDTKHLAAMELLEALGLSTRSGCPMGTNIP